MLTFHVMRKTHKVRMEDYTSDIIVERLRKVRALQPERGSCYKLSKSERATRRFDRA